MSEPTESLHDILIESQVVLKHEVMGRKYDQIFITSMLVHITKSDYEKST